MSKGFIGALLGIVVVIICGYFIGEYQWKKTKEQTAQDMATSQEPVQSTDMIASSAELPTTTSQGIQSVVTLQQTEDFIARLEKLRAGDKSVDRTVVESYSEHNRAYYALRDEAIKIYGEPTSDNRYFRCIAMVNAAQTLFTTDYDVDHLYIKQSDEKIYQETKADCLSAAKGAESTT